MAWFTVPRHFAYIIDVRTFPPNTPHLVTHPNLGVPGGYVTTTLSDDGLSGENTVVPGSHVLDGTVTRTLVELPTGELAIITVGVGTSDVPIVGPAIDAANEPLGENVFNALDGHAADRLRRAFPGC
jgi:hypothetical protein